MRYSRIRYSYAVSASGTLANAYTGITSVASGDTLWFIDGSFRHLKTGGVAAATASAVILDSTISGFNGNANVQRFIDYEVQSGQFTRHELENFFGGVEYKGNIVNIMNRPGTSRPWYEFRQANAGGTRVSAGRRFYAQNKGVIDAVAKSYGVPAEIIVAIVGI